MRAVVTVLVIVGGLIVQAIPSPADAWYDHWGRWHPNYYHHHYYYHPYGYYHHYNRHPAYGYGPHYYHRHYYYHRYY